MPLLRHRMVCILVGRPCSQGRDTGPWLRIHNGPHRVSGNARTGKAQTRLARCRWAGPFCTAELKVLPALEWLDFNDPDKEATAMTGVRRSESRHRSDAEEHIVESDRHGGRELWQPLVRHDDAMRDALLHRAGYDVLPHRSLECHPCINANIDDIRLLSEDRIRLIDITEKDLGFTRKGKPRVMFRTARRKGAVGIRAVVQWAAAPRPRDQMEMFPAQYDSGYCGG